MNSIRSYLILVTICILFCSCGSIKRNNRLAQDQQKLEIEYQKYKGVKYKYGGTDRNGFDCSGFVQIVYLNIYQINLPRTVKEMAKLGRKISSSSLRSGDLVFFRPSRKYRHVGIYIGNNQFMHSSTSKGVIKTRLDNSYWKKKYKYAKRISKK